MAPGEEAQVLQNLFHLTGLAHFGRVASSPGSVRITPGYALLLAAAHVQDPTSPAEPVAHEDSNRTYRMRGQLDGVNSRPGMRASSGLDMSSSSRVSDSSGSRLRKRRDYGAQECKESHFDEEESLR